MDDGDWSAGLEGAWAVLVRGYMLYLVAGLAGNFGRMARQCGQDQLFRVNCNIARIGLRVN